MNFKVNDPPRIFTAGKNAVEVKDMGHVFLEPDEQLTFVTQEGKEYDFCRKSWGYYSTPSINGRLSGFGFKTALVSNSVGRRFVLAVLEDRLSDFQDYCRSEDMVVETWLDEVSEG
jgi:hypothetical protein